MKVFFFKQINIYAILTILVFIPFYCWAGMVSTDKAYPVAKIHGEVITVKDVANFAKTSPNFNAMFQFPGGAPKVLNELIWRKLLLLEGHDTGIIKPDEEKNGEEELLARRVLKKNLPEFKPLTDEEYRSFYDTHKELFSTPLMLRVSQIKVEIKDNDEAAAKAKITEAENALNHGEPFSKVAAVYSEDGFSRDRGGDIGFIPMEKIESARIEKVLKSLPLNKPSAVLKNGNAFVIYMVTERKEPVSDPYDKIAELVRQKADEWRRKEAMAAFRKKLYAKWGVEYLDKEWAAPEEDR
ncbi:MAG: peptidylprolyl isomerase [Dissulfurimicrobium sp.]|uniref:peptidylprolyl isomerase n=1 Tax=Dissulfurimicrobium sp. TaxID=2022436 RepID=UPI00404A4D5B